MSANGEEVLVLTYNKHTTECHKFGSDNGLSFAERRSDFESQFLASVGGE
jgi:hypothetical protein